VLLDHRKQVTQQPLFERGQSGALDDQVGAQVGGGIGQRPGGPVDALTV
jgi:hypothetical protein